MQKPVRIKTSIFINYFLFGILLNSVGTVILQVQRYFQVLPASASLLEACKDLSIAASAFIAASFITRLGYKRSMLIALAAVSVMCFCLPVLKFFWAVKVLFVVTGASFALIRVSVFGSIGLVTTSEKAHISLMNFIESFFCMGICSGYFLFSYFIDDNETGSSRWFQVYNVLGALTACAFFFLWSTPMDESAAKPVKVKDSKDLAEMLSLLAIPLVVSFLICAFLYVLIEQSTMSWLPSFNHTVLNLPSSISVEITSFLAASYALGRLLAGVVIRRLNWFAVLGVCLLITAGLVLAALPLAERTTGKVIHSWSEAPLAAFILPAIGFFLAPIYPAMNSMILSSLPRARQGHMSGLIGIFSALGGTLGSRITGLIFQYYNGQTAFYFSLAPIGLLGICLFIFKQIKEKKHSAPIALKAY